MERVSLAVLAVAINVGTGTGVRVGGEYDVVRPGREIQGSGDRLGSCPVAP